MRFYKTFLLVCFCLPTWADTLTFVAQPSGGSLDDNWFNAINWFTTDSTGNLLPAGRVPLADETAIITGTVDLQASGVRVQTLVATNNASLTNGTLAVEDLQLLSGSSVNGVAVNVLTHLAVGGTNCTLNASTLTILSIASGSLQAIAPATASSLVLTQGAVLINIGSLSLSDRSQIIGGGLPQSKLVLQAGSLLSSTNSTVISGSAAGHLLIDNSGLVRVDGGTLVFTNGIDWQSSNGSEEFQAATPGATVLFSGPFHVDNSVTSFFTGAGTNVWLSGATIDGVAQVSSMDSVTQLAGPGQLQTSGSVTGAGTVHFLGTTNQGGGGIWSSGSLGLSGISVDPGANLRISGGGSTCRLAGCTITNFGQCLFMGGDLDFGQGAAINNEAGAMFVIQADGVFSGSAGGGALNNSGTFQKLSGGVSEVVVTNSISGPDFNNNGLFDLRNGQLNLLGGSSAGEFRQAQNAVLWFWGGAHNLNTGATFTGAGSVKLYQGNSPAKLFVNDSTVFQNLEVGLNGILDSSAASPSATVQIGALFTHDDALITNGIFQIQDFQMSDQSLVALSKMNITNNLSVTGTNCVLRSATLDLPAGALGVLQPVASASNVTLTLSQGAALVVGGQLTLMNGSTLIGGPAPSSQLVLQSGATLVCTNSAIIEGAASAPMTFDDSGAILANGGTLTLGDGLNWQSTGGANLFQTVAPSDQVLFTGAFRVNNSCASVFSGAGTHRWLQSVVVNGTVQVGGIGAGPGSPGAGNLEIAGSVSGSGSVNVTGGASPAGNIVWTGGILSISNINVNAGGTAVIGGLLNTPCQLSSGAFNNSGVCTMVGGDLSLGQNAVINNQANGTFLLQTNVSLVLAPASSGASINNAGTFVMAGNGLCVVAPVFANSGKLQVQQGTLTFQGAWNQVQGSTLVDAGATIAGANLTLSGGTLSGNGTIAGNLMNTAGAVSPGNPIGTLSLSPGQNYQQGQAAVLAIDLGGTAAGTQFDQFAIGGNASLNGQLQLNYANGFTPQPGQTFPVLTASSLSGRFTQISGPSPSGTAWVARYTPTGVSVLLAANISLPRPVISAGNINFPINTEAGLIYVVQATDALNPANWQTLETITGDGSVQTVSEAVSQTNRFFRIVLQ